jgi:hypothetical protein
LECEVNDQYLRTSGTVTDQIWSFCSAADENCALLGYYAGCSGNSLPMFRDNILTPSSVVNKMGLTGCPKMSLRCYHYMLHNSP